MDFPWYPETLPSLEELFSVLTHHPVKIEKFVQGSYQTVNDPGEFLSGQNMRAEKFIVKNIQFLFPGLQDFCHKVGLEQDIFLSPLLLYDGSALRNLHFDSPRYNSYFIDLYGGGKWLAAKSDQSYYYDFSRYQTLNARLKNLPNIKCDTFETGVGEVLYVPSGLSTQQTRQTAAGTIHLVLYESVVTYSELVDYLSQKYLNSDKCFDRLTRNEALAQYKSSLDSANLLEESKSFLAQRKLLKFKFGHL